MLAFLFLPVACKTPMSTRKDAGTAADARAEDAPADTPADLSPDLLAAKDLPLPDAPAPDLSSPNLASPDLASPDLASPDAASPAGVPKGFRLENHTDRTAYLDQRALIGCHEPVAWAGDQSCSFFDPGCTSPCASVSTGAACCVHCGQALPSMLAIPPGQSRTVPWDGKLYAQILGHCSDCACLQVTPVRSSTFAATVRVYADYECGPLPCEMTAADVITYASPRGNDAGFAAIFTIPYPDDVVIIDITWLPTTDAGAMPDLPSADLAAASDPRSDALPAPFAGLPGNTFEIVANATPPDASVEPGAVCRPPDSKAVYDIAFSPDGTAVRITRMDPVQEEVIDGKLTSGSDARLVYRLDNLFAGGELIVRFVDGKLAAQLVFFGSGLPVLGCIESPMTKL